VGFANASRAVAENFGALGSGAGQFSEPNGIAVDQETGDIYIVDTNNERIERFNSQGRFLRAWGWGVADGKSAALQTCTTADGAEEDPLRSLHGIVYSNTTRSLFIVNIDNHTSRNAHVRIAMPPQPYPIFTTLTVMPWCLSPICGGI